MPEDRLIVRSVYHDNIFHIKTVQQVGRLGGQNNLAFMRGSFGKFSQFVDGCRMQSQFRFINNYYFRRVGLQKQGGQCYKTQCSVRETVAVEVHISTFFFPFQPDTFLVIRIRAQLESFCINA